MANDLHALTRLLEEAKDAHAAAFAHVGGEDPEWPAWYAAWLQPQLSTPIEVDELTKLLTEAADEHTASAHDERWPAFYARFLTDRGVT